MLFVSVDYTAGIEKAYVKFGYPHPGAVTDQVSSASVIKMDSLEQSYTGVNLLADTELHLFGYTGNTNVGGCTNLKNLVMMLDYVPDNIASVNVNDELALIQNHFFETSTYPNTFLMDFGVRIKNIAVIQLSSHCNMPSIVQSQFTSADNTYIKKGLALGDGDY